MKTKLFWCCTIALHYTPVLAIRTLACGAVYRTVRELSGSEGLAVLWTSLLIVGLSFAQGWEDGVQEQIDKLKKEGKI